LGLISPLEGLLTQEGESIGVGGGSLWSGEEDVIFNIIAIVKVIFKMKCYQESIASFGEVVSFISFVVSVIIVT
jgi:hypothetical protein